MQTPLLNQLKVPIIVILFAFLCLYIFSKLFGPIPFYVNSVTTNKQDLFTVDGMGEATAVPSTAQVSLGISKNANTVEDAQKQVNEIANKLTADLKSLGIAEKDIKTTNYSSYPYYPPDVVKPLDVNNGVDTSGQAAGSAIAFPIRYPPTAQQYTVSENLEVTVQSTDTANKVLDLATKDGANVIGGINFVLSDEKQQELESQARKQAIMKAKQKAQDIADAAGLHLGRLVNIQESSIGIPYPVMYSKMQAVAPTPADQTSVNPGENKITVNVTLSYETY